jgi:hypothetical protein
MWTTEACSRRYYGTICNNSYSNAGFPLLCLGERLERTARWVRSRRGGINLISRLSADERERGVISASTGNPGQSLAYAARRGRASPQAILWQMLPEFILLLKDEIRSILGIRRLGHGKGRVGREGAGLNGKALCLGDQHHLDLSVTAAALDIVHNIHARTACTGGPRSVLQADGSQIPLLFVPPLNEHLEVRDRGFFSPGCRRHVVSLIQFPSLDVFHKLSGREISLCSQTRTFLRGIDDNDDKDDQE